MSWKLRFVPTYLSLSWFKRPDGWSEHTRKFFRWEHHRCLVDWIRAKEYYSHFFPLSWFKTTGRNKNLWSICRRAPKILAGVGVLNWKARIPSAHPGPQRDRKQVLPSHFFLDQYYKQFWILGFFLESWSCGSAKNPILFPYFLILWPNRKWDVFSTAVAQPRLVKLWLRWQDLLGLFFYYLQYKFPYSQ